MKKISEKKPITKERRKVFALIIICTVIGISLIIFGIYAFVRYWYAFYGLLGLGVVFVLLAVVGAVYLKRKKERT
ncbi:MAG: hypothetical protein ACXAAH_06075 [Promethearchaeota archaeon]